MTVQVTCHEHLQGAVPSANSRPIQVFSHDESRLGLLTVRRRSLTAPGVQPLRRVQHVFEWFSVCGAVAPITGDRLFLELPCMNAQSLPRSVDLFTRAFPDSLDRLLLDNSGAHTAQWLAIPEHGRLVFWPPYSPELNPIERVWRDLRGARAWLRFPTLGAQQDGIAALLQA